jgi:hypothetical protein
MHPIKFTRCQKKQINLMKCNRTIQFFDFIQNSLMRVCEHQATTILALSLRRSAIVPSVLQNDIHLIFL